MRKHLLVVGFLSLVLLLLLDRATDENGGDSAATDEALGPDYDYVLSGADSTSFRADGSTRYRLRAARVTHFLEPDHSLLEAPQLEIYPQDRSPWTVTAVQGRVEQDALQSLEGGDAAERVDLSGDVHARHLDRDGRVLNVYTEFLQVWPDDKRAESDREVRFETGMSFLTGLGLRADMETNHVQLLGTGRGIYEGNSTAP